MFRSQITQRSLSIPILCGALVVVLDVQRCPAVEATSSASIWQTDGWPLIQKYCLDCHQGDHAEAALDLSSFRTLEGIAAEAGSMQRILEMVRFGAMPPEDADLPSDEQRKRLVFALSDSLHSVSCDADPRPGRVTARRLNRAEYNHSIRDLFGLDLRPADTFPSDEVGAGFDNNSDLLTLSPILMEKYLSAAEYVASQVIVDPDSLPVAEVDCSSEKLIVEGDSQTGRFYGRFLAPDSYVWTEFEVPRAGEYRVEVYGGNGRRHHTLSTVGVYDQTGLLRGVLKLAYYGGGGSSKRDDFNLPLEAGEHRLIIRKIPDEENYEIGVTRFDRVEELTQDRLKRGREQAKKSLQVADHVDEDDYPLMVRRLTVTGPVRPRPDELPASQASLVRELPRRDRDRYVNVDRAAIICLQPFIRKAFRRPVTNDEIEPYAQLVVEATERGESFYRGLQIAITAVLVSPNFLFRVETPAATGDTGEIALTPVHLATRLSYFLWSSLPDETLLRDAEKNQLSEKSIESHVRRMIQDHKADSLATEFASQWLGLRNLDSHESDTEIFPDFDDPLVAAMRRETELLFLHVARNNLSVSEFLTADYSFISPRLAEHYGIQTTDQTTDDFVKTSLSSTPRRGVLSHASILTLTSNPTRTSPVMRGKWILENVLGTPPPDPPPGVPELEDAKQEVSHLSLREQLEMHRASATCASCHRVMDQLGFGLEGYDAIGRYRTKEDGVTIDDSGELPGGRQFNGSSELSQTLANSEQAALATTITRRLMTFALGRELTPHDECSVDDIIAATAKDGFRFVDLVLGVVKSRPFQYSQRD